MMKWIPLWMILLMVTACQSGEETAQETSSNEKSETMNTSARKLRHVVMFQFKSSSGEDDIRRVEEAFSALPSQISEIKGYEWGTNNSPEGLNQELTHCFLVTFESEADRDAYLPHPAHKAFVEVLEPHLEKAVVLDYWAND